MAKALTWIVEAAIADRRSRSSWNDRLVHWERPPSDNEEAKIQRAASIATKLVQANAQLVARDVKICPQGSYHNNTNVRLEADMDLRVQLPTLMVRYADGVSSQDADSALGYVLAGSTLTESAREVRDLLAADCRKVFGPSNVTVGNKAVSVDGFDGSHADVDLVPAFHLRYVIGDVSGGYNVIDGVGITGADGSETWNFPEQHHRNGIEKRVNTALRFKRVVRSLKRLNYELCELGAISHRIPSFLVECLVYLVPNQHFLYDEDRYGRLLRALLVLDDYLKDDAFIKFALEINDIKYLFHSDQAWTAADARIFVEAAIARLTA